MQSLDAQSFRDFRLIVVDQNSDDRLVPIIAQYHGRFPILHLSSEGGNSHARNVGVGHVGADIVGFPDDDCWYPSDLLQRVESFLAAHPDQAGVSGRAIDEAGRPSAGKWDSKAGPISRFNVWKRTCAYTVFLRRQAVDRTGGFDETLGLGPGAKWPAAEDLDYVLRCLDRGFSVHYDPMLLVHHPQGREGSRSPSPDAGERYGIGAGRVLRKNRLPWWFVVYHCSRSFAAAAGSLLTGEVGRARFYLAVGKGRVRGWRSPSTAP